MSDANVGLLFPSVCPTEVLGVAGTEDIARAENLKSEAAVGLRPEAIILTWGIIL